MVKKIAATALLFLIALNFGISKDKKISIRYEDNAQVEIVSPAGVRVMIDVYNPNNLSSAPVEKDILLTTHSHSDHISHPFIDQFPGKQLQIKAGDITQDDVVIKGIPSSHNSEGSFEQENGTDYIFIMTIGGMRIVHFGDIGQDSLTEEQLALIGDVDVAITQLVNSFSGMNLQNQKGFHLMDQVKPKLVIPTHYSQESVEYAINKWKGMYSDNPEIKVGPDNLKGDTKLVIPGILGKFYGKFYKLQKYN